MTEESGMGRMPEPEVPTPAVDDAPVAAKPDASSGESMVMLGALIVLGGWLLFSIILDTYGTDWTALAFAVLAVYLSMGSSNPFEKLASKATLLKVAGYALGVFAVFELIWDIRFAGGVIDEFLEILGALALIGGSAIAFMGARAIDD